MVFSTSRTRRRVLHAGWVPNNQFRGKIERVIRKYYLKCDNTANFMYFLCFVFLAPQFLQHVEKEKVKFFFSKQKKYSSFMTTIRKIFSENIFSRSYRHVCKNHMCFDVFFSYCLNVFPVTEKIVSLSGKMFTLL